MDKLLFPSLAIALSFAAMSVLASLGGHSSHKDDQPSARMTAGPKRIELNRRYYDRHSTP